MTIRARFGLSEPTQSGKRFVGLLTISEGEDGNWTASLPAGEEPLLARVKEALEAVKRGSPSKVDHDMPDRSAESFDAKAIEEALEGAGLEAQLLPAGDHRLVFQLDLAKGVLVGRNEALHPFAATNGSIPNKILESIAAGFRKVTSDLADAINALVAAGDSIGAIERIVRAREEGELGFTPTDELLTSLYKVDLSAAASDAHRKSVREVRMAIAERMRRFDLASQEATALLDEGGNALTHTEIFRLQTVMAVGAVQRGNRETGLAMLRKLAQEADKLPPEDRAWVWRNISLILDADDPAARHAARMSADAFLEAGNKHEAGQSLIGLAKVLMRTDARAAVEALDEMVSLLEREGLVDRQIRASALRARADRLASLGEHDRALKDAYEAVELLRGLLGAEESFVASLHLAAIEARHAGDRKAADAFEREAQNISQDRQLAHFRLAERVSELLTAYDRSKAEILVRDAEVDGNFEVIAGTRLIQVAVDDKLSDIAKLNLLEQTHQRLTERDRGSPLLQTVKLSIAEHLLRAGEPRRAEQWYRKILEVNPQTPGALEGLVQCLWDTERWGDAAVFLKKRIDIAGNRPGLLYAYGRSLVEAGDLTGAVAALTETLELAQDGELKSAAFEIRERALRRGAVVLPQPPTRPNFGEITREEFEIAIGDFDRFVSSEKRMGFWTLEDGDYVWANRPESRAQDLLHTFLKARFNERVEIFEELQAGAGRVDLYVKLAGGLAVILELKMCGRPYSSTYAGEGGQQLLHYMDNRGTSLGYLVVFDSRIRDNGSPLEIQKGSHHTIVTKFVDVRPRVKAKRSADDQGR